MNETARKMSLHEVRSRYNDFVLMTLPLLAMATYLYGMRPLALAAVAVLTANLCDRFVAVLRRVPFEKGENSSIAFALTLTLMLPASVHYYTLILCVATTILVGKAAFGGYGAYPFFPPAIGYTVAVVSWPEQLLRCPQPFSQLPVFNLKDVLLVDGTSHTLAAGGMPNISLFNLFLGNYAGAMGVTACLVILACATYLWMRKRITIFAPAAFLITCAAIAFLFPRLGGIGLAWPWQFVRDRILIVLYEVLSGSILYAAVFLINDPICTPRSSFAQCIYGILLGFATMMFRYYGLYDTGVCFALLAVNAFLGPLERTCASFVRALYRLRKPGKAGREDDNHETA